MFDRLRGRVLEAAEGRIVLDVGGVGFEVWVDDPAAFGPGEEATVYVHALFREDALALYGFARREARNMFRLLIAASGVGPKGAQAALRTYPPEKLALFILREDVAALRAIPGVGPKTARRLIVELKDRLKKAYGDRSAERPEAASPFGGAGRTPSDGRDAAGASVADAVDALLVLGIPEGEARRAVEAVLQAGGEAGSTEALLRAALRQLDRTGRSPA
ncbi:Holliday junction branch migration protein RuvA [Hydrogenibacillus schlegelii]|uniref:Holliday junction branch migration complex subunit RuvA n=1 Tax=Hydrogenibacillus schlegelii TaxID=1484 RepID=A0A179ISM6_HYDSH|nr:Holliday junction branch migration protein RuvA [Hydrogenibacillus schlegelii]OAR05233.1 hypothetical protein SA87_05565 [Hydrogenibacillus schlegelii]PTQ53499.1 MAG: Holliday junction DNA helicase RuvA [Hydrogenibacillus schlegelii]